MNTQSITPVQYMDANIHQRINYKASIISKGQKYGTLPVGYGIFTHHTSMWDLLISTSVAPEPAVNPDIIEYAQKFGKTEAYLLNNRLFFGYRNPSALRKAEYTANWKYINSLNA